MTACGAESSNSQESHKKEESVYGENVENEDGFSERDATSDGYISYMNTYVNPEEFNPDKWNGTFYIDGEENHFPMTLDAIVKYIDPVFCCYRTSTIDNLTTGEGSISLIDVGLDDIVAPTSENGGYDSASSQIYFSGNEDEDSILWGLSMWMNLTEKTRFGDVELGKLVFGEMSASESELAYISRVQLEKGGKYLADMTIDELVEVIGQPYSIMSEYALIYKYDDYIVVFTFNYKNETGEYTCCHMGLISKDNAEYDRLD